MSLAGQDILWTMVPISPQSGDPDQSQMAAWLDFFARQRAQQERELAQAIAAVFSTFPATTVHAEPDRQP